MKKYLSLLLAVVPLTTYAQEDSVSATALQEGLYVSVGGGYTNLNMYQSPLVTYTKFDDKDSAYRFTLGYQLNQNIATELSYARLGDANAVNATGPGSAKNQVSAYGIAAKLYPEISLSIKPYAKVGVSRLTNKENGDDNGTPYSYKQSKVNLTYGVGAEWLINKRLRLGLEYESFGKVGTTDIEQPKPIQAKPSMISVSLIASF